MRAGSRVPASPCDRLEWAPGTEGPPAGGPSPFFGLKLRFESLANRPSPLGRRPTSPARHRLNSRVRELLDREHAIHAGLFRREGVDSVWTNIVDDAFRSWTDQGGL